MMYLKVQKTNWLHGQIRVPSSKSQSIRAIMFAMLSDGESIVINALDSDDMQDAVSASIQLGANISLRDDQLIIKSRGLPFQSDVPMINTGNSGITTRFMLPLLGLRDNTDQSIILDCGDQMRARPIQSLVDALRSLGLHIQYLKKNGMLPVVISGQLRGGAVAVDGITSQYLSALLIALPCAPLNSEITVKNLHERPYVEMTLNCLREQRIDYTHQIIGECDIFKIQGNQRYNPFNTFIAGDFSSASYVMAAAVLMQGSIELTGLEMQDPQGDKRLVEILQAMGADIEIEPQKLRIRGGRPLKGITIDANDIPDLVPTLAVIGAYAQGRTEIVNVPQARIKETDRIHSMTRGLRGLGAQVQEHPDGITVYQSHLQGAQVKGYNDHRTVMALAVAGMLAEGSTMIDDGTAMNKTFPTFVQLMRSLGAKMECIHEVNA